MTDKKFFAFLVLGLIAAIIISGISFTLTQNPAGPDQDQDQGQNQNSNQNLEEKIASQGKIKKFSGQEEIKQFLQENQTASRSYDSYTQTRMVDNLEAGEAMTKNAIGANEDSAAPSSDSRDHSETNIQVQGVDEADIVKTDGEYIYAVSGKDLFLIRSYPAQDSEIISRIQFQNHPQNIYINDNKLVVFGRDSQIYEKKNMPEITRRGNFTFFKVFDISNQEEPKEVRDLNFEGSYFDSRMIGDYVYFVTSNPRYHYLEDAPILPRILENGEIITTEKCQGAKCLNPEVYYFDIPYDRYNFTNVAAINVQDKEEKISSEMYLFSGNQEMYVSPNNIYITYTKRVNPRQIIMEITLEVVQPMLSQEEQEKITKIRQVEDYILTEEEKWEKIGAIVEKHISQMQGQEEQKNMEEEIKKQIQEKWAEIRKKLEQTVIHKIAVNKGSLEYQTQGQVTGHVLNQFSMSEQGDYFRIATTKNRDWGYFPADSEDMQSYSNIYVLDKNMEVVGSVENLAPGERIYSARFMQDRAYLVTFKQVDPLFVVDLADPESPEVLGKLKIPGFSNYLHPYDQNTLIGIGKDTEATKWGVDEKGLKLALFDVSDVSDPKQIDTYVMGDRGSDSLALNNHKAFLFDRDKNLLALPVRLRTESETTVENSEQTRSSMPYPGYRNEYFRGAAVFHVDKEGFDLKGKIQHGDNNSYSNRVKRMLYIEDTLYSLSDNYLKMNNLEDLGEIKELRLELEPNDYQVIN